MPGVIVSALLLNEFFGSLQGYEGYCVLFSAIEEKINVGSFSEDCINVLKFYPVRADCASHINIIRKLNSILNISDISSKDIHKVCFLREYNLLNSHHCKNFKNKIKQFNNLYKNNVQFNQYIEYLNELSSLSEFTNENFLSQYF